MKDILLFAVNKFSFYYLQNKPKDNGITGIVQEPRRYNNVLIRSP